MYRYKFVVINLCVRVAFVRAKLQCGIMRE
ncbi:hypothetical protein U370_03720 [Anaplasma marginale str. Dawn]|nr:hypothetical protein U370_03720 [Anaplasma marginale str. Dawn]